MPKLLFALILSVSCCWLAAMPAAAQNHLVNSEFDDNLAFWQILNPSIAAGWDALDVDSDANSGSARVVSTQATAGTDQKGSGLLQCFDVTPGSLLEMSAWAYVPPGQDRNALPDLSVAYFDQPSCVSAVCGVSLCGSSDSAQIDTIDIWTLIESTFEVPGDVESVRIFLRPRKIEAGGSVAVHFDAVTVPEPGAGASVAAACLALAALGRRRA